MENKDIKIWAALHNPMVEESSPYTLSVHWSEEGAQKAIERSKAEVKKEHDGFYKNDEIGQEIIKWDRFHWWGVKQIRVEP